MDYSGLIKADLTALLRERDLPFSGNKDALIARLEKYDKRQPSASESVTDAGLVCIPCSVSFPLLS